MTISSKIKGIGRVPDVPTLLPGEQGYDEARTVWNAMIDERPAAIARCRNAADVTAAVRAARAAGVAVSVRGGGHNVAGSAVRDGAMMIDLSGMRGVSVDPERRTARVEGGATLADLDRASQAHGLAVPAGVVSDTGVGGLTLGGGFGWLARLHGLSIDNLLAVDLVLADGRQVRTSAEEAPDLFWALRGGGGNFGVATAFEFRLHPVGPEILFGPTVFALQDAGEVLRDWADFMGEAPRACTVWADLANAPPAPFLPEEVHGQKVLILMQSWAGDPSEGEAVLAPLKAHPAALGGFVQRRPYVEAQSFLDQTYGKGARNYWGAINHDAISDDLILEVVDVATTLPTPESDILLIAQGGAISDVPVDATAYPHRDVRFMSSLGARWREAADDARMIAWARKSSSRLGRYGRSGGYVNFISEREGREGDAYAGNLERLARIKARYDPDNLYRVNQNIAPSRVVPD
ncbi:MAG TPA: FAD-binding oxidoreductase [Woeseiaceae bacterium]|nr:FAD-binding oxidoreductase [Woeseiaceae bacterium]